MATIIPALPFPPAPSTSLSGESKALLALQSLPDDYRVYHRKTWYSFDGGVREGEADLLLLHPELGMLVLEVKGGRVAFDGRAGTWTSTRRDGTVHEIKDPFAQAQRNVKALAAKAAALTVEGQAMPEFVHGHGVVFPDCDYEPGVDPVSAPRELVVDARDLAGDVTARVEALFRAWGAGRPAAPLTRKWVKRLGQQVLAPHFSLTLALGSALGWEEKALALLHEEQDVCLDFLHLNPRALVRGGAGTGKTVVAVERARRLASAGNDVLLLCFNRPLAHHLRAVCASWEGLAGKVWAGSYHQLGAELCGRAGVAWNEPPNDLSEATRLFWNETSGVLLLEAAAKLGAKWDALVVDEAQEGREDELPEHDGDRRVPRRADGRAGGGAAARVALGGAGRGAESRPLEGRGRAAGEGGRAGGAAPPEGGGLSRAVGDRRDAEAREVVPRGEGRAGGLPRGGDRGRRRHGRARRDPNSAAAPLWASRPTSSSSSTWTGASGR